MKTIKVNNKELLLVPVPKDAYGFCVMNQRTRVGYFIKDGFRKIDLPSPDYEIVNTLSKLTEGQAKEMMIKQGYRLWYNYINETFCVLTALESFNSLIIANEIDTNNEYLILIKDETM